MAVGLAGARESVAGSTGARSARCSRALALVFAVALAQGDDGEQAHAAGRSAAPDAGGRVPGSARRLQLSEGLVAPGAPVNGLTGTGDGAAFCNIFRVPGAAPAGASTPGIVRYARAQLRAWKCICHGVVAGAVRPIRVGGVVGASAVEQDAAYAVRETGRWPSSRRDRTCCASSTAATSGELQEPRPGGSSDPRQFPDAEGRALGGLRQRGGLGGAASPSSAAVFAAARSGDGDSPTRTPCRCLPPPTGS